MLEYILIGTPCILDSERAGRDLVNVSHCDLKNSFVIRMSPELQQSCIPQSGRNILIVSVTCWAGAHGAVVTTLLL